MKLGLALGIACAVMAGWAVTLRAQPMSAQSIDAEGYTIHTGPSAPSAERLRITQDGLVGIATSAPSTTLTVSGTTWSRFVQLASQAGGAGVGGGSFSETDPKVGTLTANKWCTANAGGSQVVCTTDAPAAGAAGNNTELQFNNSGAFGAAAGLTWNGSTLAASNLSTGGTLNVTGAATLGSIGTGAINASGIISGTGLYVSGDISFTGILTDVSDRRMKDNITPLGPGMLADINRLVPVAFTMKGSDRVELGFIAQDVDAVFPALVFGSRTSGTLSLNQMGMIAPVVAAVQELATENATLRERLDALTARLEHLENKKARAE